MNEKSKSYGTWTLTFLVIANMIGAGVFITSGFSMMDLASPEWVLLAWAVGGLIAIAGAISYGQLIQKMPESGGEYLFLSRAWHPMFGFVAGWVSMIAGFTGAIAVAATTFEQFAIDDATRQAYGIPKDVLATVLLLLAAACHGIRVKPGMFLQNAAVMMKLLLLVSFLVIAVFRLPSIEVVRDLPPSDDRIFAFCRVLMWISLSYLGFNAAVYVAEEVGDAKSMIPKSLLLGTVLVVVVYVALNAVFVYSGSTSEIANSGYHVASFSARQLGGPGFETLFRVIICVALLTSVTSMMMAAPRVYAKMAEDGMLPKVFKFQNETPQYATILQVLLAAVIVWISTLRGLLEYLGVTLSLCAAASVTALFQPRFRDSHSWWSIKILAPAFYVLATLFAVTMTCMYRSIWQLYAALATFAVGVVAYLIHLQWSGRDPQDHRRAD